MNSEIENKKTKEASSYVVSASKLILFWRAF